MGPHGALTHVPRWMDGPSSASLFLSRPCLILSVCVEYLRFPAEFSSRTRRRAAAPREKDELPVASARPSFVVRVGIGYGRGRGIAHSEAAPQTPSLPFPDARWLLLRVPSI